ncbi:MAG: AAA family ATPase [Mucispirillum sp.]|uniref:Chromosome partition protein Smc n=1 Tax=Candidatus Mucispirillum faecigallinarum TaxID=2838699 RepID=A0A9D2GTE7_9BACT|nr:AAA family ATPase [Mucispirillum sp.]HIZ88646.1 AAA family ATPase [Candidatus Mucispirillum faecigallinarum]
MKFNKLYLHGFKSFVDKTTVDFPDGITAIVGPNGSGKSNIMDAVRWVFGEQNAKELRGADMEDIVFNGSQKRKPAGFAEVGLTLSDIDEAVAAKYGTFSEITITRKFYKTGEREYYINNRKCRLKDIKDIFMDTGLGARSISIIEQGKVDKIINASPEELRFFLEETAGVTKFKDKKKEAERRLQQTRDNLDRVTDIIEEIVTQMQSLSAQVEQLKIYEELQSNFKRLEQSYLCTSYYIKAEDSSKVKSLLIEKKQNLESLLAKYAELVRIENVANNDYNARQAEYESLQEKRVQTATKKANTEGDIKALETKIASSDDIKANLQSSIRAEKERYEEMAESIESLTDELDTAGDALEFVSDKLEELSDMIDDLSSQKEEVEDEFKETDAAYIEYTGIITSKRNELIRIESAYEHGRQDIERLKKEQQSLSDLFSDAARKKDNFQQEIDDLQFKMMQDEENLNAAKEKTEQLKKQKEAEESKTRELKAEIKSYENNIAFFNKQLEAASSFNDDTAVLKPYIAGLLIDFLSDMDSARLIDIGDVIVFNDDKKDELFEKIAALKSSVRFAFKSEIENIRNHLLNMQVHEVYQNIYLANNIYKKAGEEDKGFQIVSLKESIMDAEKQIDKLGAEIFEIEKITGYLSSNLEESINIQNDIQSLYNNSRDNFLKKETEYSAVMQEYERLEKRSQTILKEIELAESSLSENFEKVESLKEEVNAASLKQVELEEKRAELEEKLEVIKDNLDEKREEHTEVKIQYAQKEEQTNSIKRELASKRSIREEIKNNISKLENRLQQLLNIDEIKWNEELELLKESLDNLSKEVLSLEDEVRSAAVQLDEMRQNIEDIKKRAENINGEIKEGDDEVRKYELDLAGISSVLEASAAQYMEKYGKEITHEYLSYADKDREPRKIKEEMNRIESRLDDLGPINLNALNDYNEAEERYKFLTDQRSDLEGSIDDINAFINETDEATVRMFEETFNSVKEKFVEVFHILFGNGEAELKLTDPDNMLISGVEIYIQPPGKKLQHMGLLSGGEKALTAMTLLFALFLQKPTPFCFLDEVDAPLDDANVERYVGMVKALSDKTQFILITHNHNTMSIADSIYGVAMQEYGVSTILSVTLEQVARAGR